MAETVLLDPQHIEFVEGGVSIRIASRDARNQPTVAIGLGCQVAADRNRITLYIANAPGRKLLDNLRQSGVVAVYFHQAATNRTIQIKGSVVAVKAAAEAARPLLARYIDLFEIAVDRFFPELVRVGLSYPLEHVSAVTFTPEAAFTQTPGPRAGRSLPP